jgi:hypothetical protein
VDIAPVFTRKTVEDDEVRCQCCVKLEIELNEVTSELKSATDIIRFLKEELDLVNTKECNNASNIHIQEEGTYSTAESGNWTQVPVELPTKDKHVTKHPQKTSTRSHNRFEVLYNLKEATELGRMVHSDSRKPHRNSTRNGSVSSRHTKSKDKYSEQISYSIPVIVNGAIQTNNNVEVLTSGSVNTNDSDSVVVSARKIEKTNSDDSVSNLVPKVSNENKSHTVVIYGDSHTRGCASKKKDNLKKTFNVTGLVKPGSDIRTLTNTDKGTFHNLTKNDVIIFWGGANDVKKNNTKEGLRHVLNFVRNNTHTDIIFMSVPPRHDLVSWPCVNNEVDVFNRKLQKTGKKL